MPLPQKILISYHNFPPIAYDLSDAFRRLGIDTRLFITSDCEHRFYRHVIRRVNKLARNLRLVKKGRDLFSNHPLNRLPFLSSNFRLAYEEFQPDFIFFIHGQPFGNEVLSDIPVPKVAWWVEPNDDIDELRRFAKPFDMYVSFSDDAISVLESEGISSGYLCHAASPARFHPLPGVPQTYDVAFVGNWSPWREAVIERLLSVTRNIALYGPMWKKKSKLPKADLAVIYKGDEIVGAELNALFNASRVVLNAQRVTGTSGLNMRFFEVPAAGGCYLTDTALELGRHFVPGKHLCVYEDLDDLVKQARMLLSDDKLRDSIRHAGREEVLLHHTYDHMARRLLAIYRRLLPETRNALSPAV